MPLVLDPEAHSVERLRELLDDQRSGLESLLPRFQDAAPGYRDPISLRTAADLVADALRAVDRLAGPDATRDELAAAVNLAYSTVVAGIDLWKTHSGGPLVPRGRAAKPTKGTQAGGPARRRRTAPSRPRRSSRAG
ncbi:MAG: hypothetical protein L3K16_05050 [Thermoplasmata archaeon]|nr:hypothetical protein [Thermoplasmata archaeon]